MTRTALVVMDVQESIVARYPDPDYLPRLRTAIEAARSAGLPVIYVVVGFRPGAPEVSPNNRMFSALAGRVGTQPNEIHPDVRPLPDDIVVTKRRVSAFAGSDLELLLLGSSHQDRGYLGGQAERERSAVSCAAFKTSVTSEAKLSRTPSAAPLSRSRLPRKPNERRQLRRLPHKNV